MSLHLWRNEVETYVAESAEEALGMAMKLGDWPTLEDYKRDCGDYAAEFEKIDDNAIISVTLEAEAVDGLSGPEAVKKANAGMTEVSQKASTWVEKSGKGFLCSSEF
jgi:hypothetical protein